MTFRTLGLATTLAAFTFGASAQAQVVRIIELEDNVIVPAFNISVGELEKQALTDAAFYYLNCSTHAASPSLRTTQLPNGVTVVTEPMPGVATASLGGSVEVPTIDGGRVKVTIPEGTQSGHQFRLKGKGMSVLRSQAKGDMYLEVAVETPVNLSKKQKDLLKEFEGASGGKPTSPAADSFFTRVKEFWEDLKE